MVTDRKFFLASTTSLVAALGATFALTSLQASRSADSAAGRALEGARRAVDAFLAERTRTISALSRVSAGVSPLRERLLARDERGEALDQARETGAAIGAAWVLVTDEDGTLIARTDYPDEVDRDLAHAPLVAAALDGEHATGAWLDDLRNEMFIAVSTPLRASATSAPQGALVVAYEIDDSLAYTISEATNTDVVFFMLDSLGQALVVASTLERAAIAGAVRDSALVAALPTDTARALAEVEIGGDRLIGRSGPIRSAAGDVRGGFVTFRSRQVALGGLHALRRTLMLAMLVGIAVGLGVAAFFARSAA
jgi:hypothetical protein